jgi:hypothetical protein
LRAEPERLADYLFPDDDEGTELEHAIDLDKAWHGIHYLLNGTAEGGDEPYSLVILGGQEIGEDLGYGPARLLFPDQVADIAGALRELDADALEARFDAAAMEEAQIYPGQIWSRDGQEALDYLLHHYAQLVDFYEAAAARGDGMILWLG